MSISDVSRLLDISRPTLYKWQRQLETKCLLGSAQTFFTGSTAPKVPGPPTWLSKIIDESGIDSNESPAYGWCQKLS